MAPARAEPTSAAPMTAPSPSMAPEAAPDLESATDAAVTAPVPEAVTFMSDDTSIDAERAVAKRPKMATKAVFMLLICWLQVVGCWILVAGCC